MIGRQSSEDENFIIGSDVNAGDKLYSSESEKSAAAAPPSGVLQGGRPTVKVNSSETESARAAPVNPYDDDVSGPANELENEDDFWN